MLLSVVCLAGVVLASPAPSTSGEVYRLRVPRAHLVSRSTDKIFHVDRVQQDLDKVTKHTTRNAARYARFQKNHVLKERALDHREPFDVATLRKRHDVATLKKRQSSQSVSLTDDVVYGSFDSPSCFQTDLGRVGQDNDYYGDVSFGTPAQILTIDFDTGSADLWVPDAAAVQAQASGGGNIAGGGDSLPPVGGDNTTSTGSSDDAHTPFNPSDSSTFTSSTTAFSITYGSGAAAGTLGTDVVTIGSMTVQRQVLAVVDRTSSTFAQVPFDGLMGLAYSTIAESQAPTFFENLVEEGKLASNVFSFTLGRGEGDPNGQVQVPNSGTLLIGGVDSSHYTGSIVYEDVTVKGYWETKAAGIEVNGQIVAASANMNVAWDSGTSLAYVPTRIAAAVASALGAQQEEQLSSVAGGDLYLLPCSQFRSGIDVAFSFGGQSFAWDSSDLNGGAVDNRGQYCALNIIGADTQDPLGASLAIVGDSFLKNVVTVFDYQNSRVGMATASGKVTSSSSSGSNNAAQDSSPAARPALSFTLTLLGLASLFFLSQ